MYSEHVDVTLVSPRNYFLYSPLLPSASVGTVEQRSIVEPVRKMLGSKVSLLEEIILGIIASTENRQAGISKPCLIILPPFP